MLLPPLWTSAGMCGLSLELGP